ncbi:MAG: DUF4367 domain-containing protein [Ardenticatenales bacterium]
MPCKRVALMTILAVSIAACGPKGGDDAVVPAGGAPAVQPVGTASGAENGASNDAASSAPADGAAVVDGTDAAGIGDANATAAIGMISSGTVARPSTEPEPTRPIQPGISKMMTRDDLKKAATLPLFEAARTNDDDMFVYQWVTPRDGETDPALPMARMIVTLDYTNTFVLTQWAGKGNPLPAEEGTPEDVTVGGAAGKLWNVSGKTVIIWDNGETRLRIQSSTISKDALLKVAEALVPFA